MYKKFNWHFLIFEIDVNWNYDAVRRVYICWHPHVSFAYDFQGNCNFLSTLPCPNFSPTLFRNSNAHWCYHVQISLLDFRCIMSYYHKIHILFIYLFTIVLIFSSIIFLLAKEIPDRLSIAFELVVKTLTLHSKFYLIIICSLTSLETECF